MAIKIPMDALDAAKNNLKSGEAVVEENNIVPFDANQSIEQRILNRLNIMIDQLNMVNQQLYYIAGGGKEPDVVINCPKCHKTVKPNNLGYCPICKLDFKLNGLLKEKES